MLNCRYIIKKTGEVSKTYEALKDYTKDYYFLTEGDKTVDQTKIEDAEYLSEKMYIFMYQNEFKEWFGFDFEKDVPVEYQHLVNEQGEPKLFTENRYGKQIAYFKNFEDDTMFVERTDISEQNYDIQEELTGQLLYFIVNRKLNNLEDTNTAISKLDNIIEEFDTIVREDESFDEAANQGLAYIQEYKYWIKKDIEHKLKSMSIKYQEEVKDADEIEEASNVGEVVRKESKLSNSKNKASANVKTFLSYSIPKVILDKDTNEYSYSLGRFISLPVYEPFGVVWNILERTFANIPNTYQLNSQGEVIYENGEPIFINRKKAFVNKLNDLLNIKPGVQILIDTIENMSENEFSEFSKAFTKASVNYLTTEYNPVRDNEEGDRFMLKTIVNHRNNPEDVILNQWFLKLRNSFINENGKVEINKNKFLDNLINAFLKDANDNKSYRYESVIGSLRTLGIEINDDILTAAYIKEKEVTPTINTKDKYVTKLLRGLNRFIDGSTIKDQYGNLKNPYEKELKTFGTLASQIAISRGMMGENTTLGPKGKYWNFSQMTFIDQVVLSSKLGDHSYLNGLKNNAWSKNSLLAENIREGKIKILTQLQFKQKGKKGLDNSSINEHDDFISQVNRLLVSNIHNMLAPADKSSTYLLEGLRYFKPGLNEKVTPILMSLFKNYAESEHELNTQTGKKTYTLLGGRIDESFFKEDGTIKMVKFEEAFTDWVRKEVMKIKDKYSLFNQDMAKKFFDEKLQDDNNHFKIDFLLREYIINSEIGNIEMTKVFTGHPSYYKSSKDKNLKNFTKRVPATQTDGVYLSLSEKDPINFNIAITDEITQLSKVIIDEAHIERVYQNEKQFNPNITKEDVKSVLKDYNESNIADAQAWITLDRWKFLYSKTQTWNDNLEKLYQKAKRGEILSYEESKIFSAQPLKGVHFELKDGEPYFLKYSQAVLIPSLIKGSDLEIINDRMIKEDIQELITGDGVKVGNELRIKLDDGNGRLSEDFLSGKTSFENVKISLSNRYWKLQQELPSKKIKQGTLASQIQKNIFMDLSHFITNYPNERIFDGKTASEVFGEIVETVNSIINTKQASLFNKLEINLNENLDLSSLNDEALNEIKNIVLQELDGSESQDLIQTIEEGIIIKKGGGSNLDTFITVKDRIQNVLASYLKKKLMDVTMNVGSMIQISNFGTHKLNNDVQSGIYWLKDESILDGPVLNKDGSIKKGEVLLPSWLISQHIPNYQKLSREKLMELIDERLFDIVGYRIPNQGLSSNDALKVVGVLPPEAGDSVIVYNGITTKTGSDFDIDKMYMLFPNMKVKYKDTFYKAAKKYLSKNYMETLESDTIENLANLLDEYNIPYKSNNEALSKIFIGDDTILTDELIEDVIELIIKDPSTELSKDFKLENLERVEYIEDTSLKGLQNKLLELYSTVLSSKGNYLGIIKSIDKSTQVIKNKIESIRDTSSTFNVYSGLDNATLRNNLIKGKNGVGSTANQLVNHALTQLYDVYSGVDSTSLPQNNVYDRNQKHKISEIISGFLNAFVDIAKDPYILDGNINTTTTSTMFYLLRAGIPVERLIDFLSHPGLKEYVNKSTLKTSVFLRDFTSDEITTSSKIMKRLSNQLLDSSQPLPKMSNDQAVDVFKMLKKQAQSSTRLIQASQFEVNGAGNTTAKVMSNIIRVYNLYKSDLNYDNLDKYFNQNTILGNRFISGVLTPHLINQQLFFESNLIDEINNLYNAIYGENAIDHEKTETVVNFIKSKIYDDIFETNLELFKSSYKINGLTIPKLIEKLRNKYPQNKFIYNLKESTYDNKYYLGIDNMRDKDATDKNQLIEGFKELLINENEFANYLVTKEFHQNGFRPSLESFYEYIPNSYWQEIQSDVLNSITKFKDLIKDEAYLTKVAIEYAYNNIEDIKGLSPNDVEKGYISKGPELIKKYKGKVYVATKELDINLFGFTVTPQLKPFSKVKGQYLRYVENTQLPISEVINPLNTDIISSVKQFIKTGQRTSAERFMKPEVAENVTPVKDGVEELFDSNPELANQVYESLGFVDKSSIELEFNIDETDGINIAAAIDNQVVGNIELQKINNNYFVRSVNSSHENQGIATELYKKAIKYVTEKNGVLKPDIASAPKILSIYRKLEKTGLFKIKNISEQWEDGRYTIEGKSTGVIPKKQITPQQKEKAIEAYSQYLDTIFPKNWLEGNKDLKKEYTIPTEKEVENLQNKLDEKLWKSIVENKNIFTPKKETEEDLDFPNDYRNITEKDFNNAKDKNISLVSEAGEESFKDLLLDEFENIARGGRFESGIGFFNLKGLFNDYTKENLSREDYIEIDKQLNKLSKLLPELQKYKRPEIKFNTAEQKEIYENSFIRQIYNLEQYEGSGGAVAGFTLELDKSSGTIPLGYAMIDPNYSIRYIKINPEYEGFGLATKLINEIRKAKPGQEFSISLINNPQMFKVGERLEGIKISNTKIKLPSYEKVSTKLEFTKAENRKELLPEQIRILGSKQDIQGFKEFVNNDWSESSYTKPQSKLTSQEEASKKGMTMREFLEESAPDFSDELLPVSKQEQINPFEGLDKTSIEYFELLKEKTIESLEAVKDNIDNYEELKQELQNINTLTALNQFIETKIC